eukprot:GHVU01084577.1.p2 GENE.GHVU01084577.1~~GHVU01084577.1.p2  ORF type:complete len:163 (-),score=20.46 GHVU01084577.1:850-1338(-)
MGEDKLPPPIGQYKIGKTVGEGAFGKVKMGVHMLTNERVAVKMLEKSRFAEDVDNYKRVMREISILKTVNHPHVLQLYEIVETDSHIMLVTEYAGGGELFDYIVSKKRVPEGEAAAFLLQIVSGLQALHRQKIVHRCERMNESVHPLPVTSMAGRDIAYRST